MNTSMGRCVFFRTCCVFSHQMCFLGLRLACWPAPAQSYQMCFLSSKNRTKCVSSIVPNVFFKTPILYSKKKLYLRNIFQKGQGFALAFEKENFCFLFSTPLAACCAVLERYPLLKSHPNEKTPWQALYGLTRRVFVFCSSTAHSRSTAYKPPRRAFVAPGMVIA